MIYEAIRSFPDGVILARFGQVQLQHVIYNIITSFSGRREETAFNTNAINALKRIGFEIKMIANGTNPFKMLGITLSF